MQQTRTVLSGGATAVQYSVARFNSLIVPHIFTVFFQVKQIHPSLTVQTECSRRVHRFAESITLAHIPVGTSPYKEHTQTALLVAAHVVCSCSVIPHANMCLCHQNLALNSA